MCESCPHHSEHHKHVTRRRFLGVAASFGLFWKGLRRSWAAGALFESPGAASLTVGAEDLRIIFKDEIRANFKGNVYASLGNRLELDGATYARVLQALTSYDLGNVLGASSSSDSMRGLVEEQHQKTEVKFQELLQGLEWPQLQVQFGKDSMMEVSGPVDAVQLYAGKDQPLIVVFRNKAKTAQSITLKSAAIEFPATPLTAETGETRYLKGTIKISDPSLQHIDLLVEAGGANAVPFTLHVAVERTVILEGVLVAEQNDSNEPMARVRVTDSRGKYWPPESQPSGLIRILKRGGVTRGERWAYVVERFKVRVPTGPIHVSVRRGLEYIAGEEDFEVGAEEHVERKFLMKRWANMESAGWYSGDMHVHMLDPATALLESKAESLNYVNVMVFRHLEDLYAAENFTGKLDAASDDRHFVYYNEEFRNEPMGHIGLMNIKKLVEPISTGYLGLHLPTIMRFESLNMDLPMHGAKDSPDYPLLLKVMREAHKQGGMVSWAHLRSAQWEFPLDAEEHQIDVVDIMTHTQIPQDLDLWYALLNCNFNIPAIAGTDRIEPTNPIGHQRTYVLPEAPLTYESFTRALRKGRSFVTNGPMLELTVNGNGPGMSMEISTATKLTIFAKATSQIPFERLEILVNGKVVKSAPALQDGKVAAFEFDYVVHRSAWVAARCMGAYNSELYYTHPVFAHTSPVQVRNRNIPIRDSKSARMLRDILSHLLQWAQKEAYYDHVQERSEVTAAIQKGVLYFDRLARGRDN